MVGDAIDSFEVFDSHDDVSDGSETVGILGGVLDFANMIEWLKTDDFVHATWE